MSAPSVHRFVRGSYTCTFPSEPEPSPPNRYSFPSTTSAAWWLPLYGRCASAPVLDHVPLARSYDRVAPFPSPTRYNLPLMTPPATSAKETGAPGPMSHVPWRVATHVDVVGTTLELLLPVTTTTRPPTAPATGVFRAAGSDGSFTHPPAAESYATTSASGTFPSPVPPATTIRPFMTNIELLMCDFGRGSG